MDHTLKYTIDFSLLSFGCGNCILHISEQMHQFLHFNSTMSDILEAKSTGECDSHGFWCLEQPMGAVQLEQI